MLGINDPSISTPRPYRNYAAVEPGDAEFAELERLGLVELYKISCPPFVQYDYYRCTETGRTVAIASHKSIRWPRGRRRYVSFLRLRDACPGVSFREFLTDPLYAEARR
jgi:ribosomal protein S27AE